MRVQIYGKYGGLPSGHLGTATNPAPSCQALALAGITRSQEYIIGAGSELNRVWCQLDVPEYPGGWQLLMKANEGTTFEYDADHWTQPTVLNEHDVTLDAGDAKYPGYNTAEITDVLAHFPGIASGAAYWHVGPFAPTTALELFQTPWAISTNPLLEQNWNGEYFSHQDGIQLYSFNNVDGGRPQFNVRWGYRCAALLHPHPTQHYTAKHCTTPPTRRSDLSCRLIGNCAILSWNNEGDFGSNDAGGGIGTARDHAASASDWCAAACARAVPPSSTCPRLLMMATASLLLASMLATEPFH